MPSLFERDLKGLLVFATMLEGCGYYGCKDDLKREYVPGGESWYRQVGSSSWQDAQTLEISFNAPLRPPTEVDPRRFALLRYNVKFDHGDYYYCHFDLCHRALEVEAIPESLDWNPAEPEVLQLHFAEPIPSSSCEPWKGNRADFQALELIYLGVEEEDFGTDTGDLQAEPDQLAYADDQAVEAIGPDRARSWLAACFAGGSCELDEFCIDRGGFSDWEERDLWVDCP